MSRRDHFGWYTPAPKKPPPEHGIRVKKAGTTWWGQRWIGALEEVLRGDAARLARGRTYARAGRTHDLVVKGGKVTARVTGSRPTPYKITIELARLSEAAWAKAIAGMAAKAQFSAELLAGQMPQDIDEVFRGAGASLFPRQRADLTTTCSCPDWGDPCKHVAATHYVLGEAFDRDPFLLFELRGKTKEQVLDALRNARGTATEGQAETARRGRSKKKGGAEAAIAAVHEIPTVTLSKVKPADYDKPREALPSLHFTFDEPATHGAVLRQLGAPPAWQGEASPADVFAPRMRAAAEIARRIAMAEARSDTEEPSAGDIDVAGSSAPAAPRSGRAPARKGAAKRGGA